MGEEGYGPRAHVGIGIEETGASLCKVLFLTQQGRSALAGTRVSGQSPLGPVHGVDGGGVC